MSWKLPFRKENRDWEAELNRAIEELSGVYRFKDDSGKGAAFGMLPLQVLLGAEFRMPFYERLSLGALYPGTERPCLQPAFRPSVRELESAGLHWSLSTGTTLNRWEKASESPSTCIRPA